MRAIVLILLAVSGAAAAAPPAEEDHFAPLLGTWLVDAKSLQRDGQTWVENPHPAEWRFYRILGGEAIQDDFISPAPHIQLDKGQRTWGTNIRIFNREKNAWEMAWIATGGREVLSFSATYLDGEIIMSARGVEPPRRNVFHNISADRFSWRQDWSFDAGETWVPVAHLEARRAN